MKTKSNNITNHFIDTVCSRLAANKRVRRSLPEWGRVHIDRQLPFICIYRRQHEEDESQTERLIIGEASYLFTSWDRKQQKQLSLLVKRIAQTLKESFGSFLIVEIWLAKEDKNETESVSNKPVFRIYKPKRSTITSTIETLERTLKEIKIQRKKTEVEIVNSIKIAPPGISPMLSSADLKLIGCHSIGIEVQPIFKNTETDQIFPLIRRELQKGFARALKNSFFEFARNHTTHQPLHYHSLGRWSMVKAVWEVDRQLADICNGFDFLLQVTPTNGNAAWSAFQRKRFENAPNFIYRPLPVDPTLIKRQLFRVPIERIEDPTIAQLFREQQLELDRKLTMLTDKGTPAFKYGSLQLFGPVEDSLMKQAIEILDQLSPRSRDESSKNFINAKAFAERAIKELAYFRETIPEIQNKVTLREDITGLMVSQGNLLIGAETKIPVSRMEALIQHEVGTHVLTYINGKSQPLRQLYIGLAGYDELQEGLAVLSEYFVDGLTSPRLRLLAARVVAASRMVNGASFIEVFRELNKIHGFERRTAFVIAMRTFRCGGLTKDAVYLRGLIQLLKYLKNGGEIEALYVGKISVNHVAIINELQWRKILHSPPLRPSYIDYPQTAKKIEDLRNGLTLIELIKRSR